MDRASAREPLAACFYGATHAVPRGLHAVERNRRLTAAALGYAVEGAVDYGLDRAASEKSAQVVFLTMTSRADKLWPEGSWIDLGKRLSAPLVLPWGSAEERARAERIAAVLPQANVPPRMAIAELAALFAGARAVVGVDTGLTHLAAALGAPTAGIYCGSDPALTGLYGAPAARNVGTIGHPPSVAEVLGSLG
jgi:heptosyltransferase-1